MKKSASKYQLIECLSRNQVAESWTARIAENGKQVFLKISSNDQISEEESRRFLVQSYTAQRHLKTSLINCATRRSVVNDALVVEYPWLDPEKWKVLDIDKLLGHFDQLFAQLCMAVDILHLNGLVHADLKLDNFMTAETHLGPRLILTDLDFLMTAGIRPEAKVFGTPGLIAPEIIANDPVTISADIYSLGNSITNVLADTDSETAQKCMRLANLMSQGDVLVRPSYMLDAAFELGIFDEKQYKSHNRQLLSMQLIKFMSREINEAGADDDKLFDKITRDYKVFGIPSAVFETALRAYSADKRAAVKLFARYIDLIEIERYEDCWQIEIDDKHLVDLLTDFSGLAGKSRLVELPGGEANQDRIWSRLSEIEALASQGDFLEAYLSLSRLREFITEKDVTLAEEMNRYILEKLAFYATTLGRTDQAIEHYRERLDCGDELNLNQLSILQKLVFEYMKKLRVDDALEQIERGIELSRKIGSKRDELRFRRYQCWIISQGGDYEKSLSMLKDIYEQAVGIKDYHLMMDTLSYLGAVHWHAGRLIKAEEYLLQGLEIARKYDLMDEAVGIMANLSLLYTDLGQYSNVVKYSNMRLEYARNPEYRYGLAFVYNNLSMSYIRMGEYDKAFYYAQKLLTERYSAFESSSFGRYYFAVGWLRLNQGQFAEARRNYYKAIRIVGRSEFKRLAAKHYQILAEIAAYQGRIEECRQHIKQAEKIFSKYDDTYSLADTDFLGTLNAFYNEKKVSCGELLRVLQRLIEKESYYFAARALTLILLESDDEIKQDALSSSEKLLPIINRAETPLYRAVQPSIKLYQQDSRPVSNEISALKSAFQELVKSGDRFMAMHTARRIAELYFTESRFKQARKFYVQVSKLAELIDNIMFRAEIEERIESISDLLAEEKRSIKFLEEFSTIVKDLRDYESVLDRLVRFAVDETGAERGAILLKSAPGSELRIKSYFNCDDESLRDIEDISKNVSLSALETAQPLIIEDAQSDKRTRNFKSIFYHNILSVACVPIAVDDHHLGVLYLDHHTIPALFDNEDLTIIKSMANFVALTLKTAREYNITVIDRDQLRDELEDLGWNSEMITGNRDMQNLLSGLPNIATSGTDVLILGESGTGKTLLAQMIHDLSGRKNGPFVKVNCPSIPGGLFESEMFGIGKGVATQVGARKGKIEAAEGGTLLLDEIGDLDLGLQSKILRVLGDYFFASPPNMPETQNPACAGRLYL